MRKQTFIDNMTERGYELRNVRNGNVIARKGDITIRWVTLANCGESLWNGYEYMGRHGGTAARVAKNIIRSRIARASHGKPTAEPLERTALRLLKRAGRPELSERYARIRKHIAATHCNA